MSTWAPLVAIGAVFVLILVLGLKLLAQRSADHAHPHAAPAHRQSGAESFPATPSEQDARAARAAQDASALQSRIDAAAQSRAQAEADAAAIVARAEGDAEALRRSANTEIDALRKAADSAHRSAEANAAAHAAQAERAARELVASAERSAARLRSEAEADERGRIEALAARETALTAGEAALARTRTEHDARARELSSLAHELETERRRLAAAHETAEADRVLALQHVAELTSEQAKAELLAVVESGARRDAAMLVRGIENEARAEGVARARAIVVDAVQRVASEQTAESVVSVLHIPSEEMKGRIIGREGRNIRAFESVTGVNVIIDDTPEAVLLSCFDPVRREIGRITLQKLVADGRIHPQRIEDVYETARAEVDELCLRAARDALADVGIMGLDESLVPTIGRLKYRTSYGQNVLGHLIETAQIAGVMAAELGLDVRLMKRCAFLHDIGKAMTPEVEGSHAIIGAELLRSHGESEDVAHAVEAHHNEVTPHTIEAVLTQAADACSAGRPGARRETLETYVKRLRRIEEIASSRPGVDRVFAMQSGREVRVMVLPNEIDDLAAGVIAREVAKQIEDELTYPGQIRVTVVRESRATEVAH